MLSKLITIFLWVFYIALIVFSTWGLLSKGVNDIQTVIFYFVLLGLLCLPFLSNLIPSLESLNIFGFELKIKKQVEENQKYVKDLEKRSEDNIRNIIFSVVKEESLTDEGKEQLIELRHLKDEI